MTVHPRNYAVRQRHRSPAAKPVVERLEERQLLLSPRETCWSASATAFSGGIPMARW